MGGTESAANAASTAGNATSTVGTAADAVSTAGTTANAAGGAMGSTGSIYGNMADVSNYGNTGSTLGTAGQSANSGFSYNLPEPSQGPTLTNTSDLVADRLNTYNEAVRNMSKFGTSTPDTWDKIKYGAGKVGEFLDDYKKGAERPFFDWKGVGEDFGLNGETLGYFVGKPLNAAMSGAGGSPQAPPIVTNISYQQPENEYLSQQKRRRLY